MGWGLTTSGEKVFVTGAREVNWRKREVDRWTVTVGVSRCTGIACDKTDRVASVSTGWTVDADGSPAGGNDEKSPAVYNDETPPAVRVEDLGSIMIGSMALPPVTDWGSIVMWFDKRKLQSLILILQ